jgi:hypothetical protein
MWKGGLAKEKVLAAPKAMMLTALPRRPAKMTNFRPYLVPWG